MDFLSVAKRVWSVLGSWLQKRELVSEVLGLAAAALLMEYLCLSHCSCARVVALSTVTATRNLTKPLAYLCEYRGISCDVGAVERDVQVKTGPQNRGPCKMQEVINSVMLAHSPE